MTVASLQRCTTRRRAVGQTLVVQTSSMATASPTGHPASLEALSSPQEALLWQTTYSVVCLHGLSDNPRTRTLGSATCACSSSLRQALLAVAVAAAVLPSGSSELCSCGTSAFFLGYLRPAEPTVSTGAKSAAWSGFASPPRLASAWALCHGARGRIPRRRDH